MNAAFHKQKYQIFLKNPSSGNGSILANPKNPTFFLDAISQLFWHITCLFDTRYQMSISEDGVRGQTKSI